MSAADILIIVIGILALLKTRRSNGTMVSANPSA